MLPVPHGLPGEDTLARSFAAAGIMAWAVPAAISTPWPTERANRVHEGRLCGPAGHAGTVPAAARWTAPA